MNSAKAILKINISNRTIQINGKTLHFSGSLQFFYLYTYLAFRKKGGLNWAYCEDIHCLIDWKRKNIYSVGKEIAAHISKQEKEGIKLISYKARGKTKGPYSLNIPPENIFFDKKMKDIAKEFLKLREFFIPIVLEEKERDGFYDYAIHLTRGFWNFNQGELNKSLGEIEAALNSQIFLRGFYPAHKINLLCKKAQFLEKMGDSSGSIASLKEAERLIKSKERAAISRYKKNKYKNENFEKTDFSQEDMNFLKTKIFLGLGYSYFRKRDLNRARPYYEEAQKFSENSKSYNLIGDLHKGLGLLSLHGEKKSEALQHFDTALNYYLLSENLYGIQAVCFNIANTFYKIAVIEYKSKKDLVNLNKYLKRAESWAEKTFEITKETRLGKDTVQTEILLSIIHLEKSELASLDEEKLKELDLAIKYSVKGEKVVDMLKMEEYVESKFDLATVQKVIGIICARKSEILLKQKHLEATKDCRSKAKIYLKKAKAFFEKSGLPKPVKEINQYIEKLR